MLRRCLLAALACLLLPAPAAMGAPGGASTRIVGGHDVDIAEWPFLAAIVSADRSDAFQGQFCGGSLIAPRVVLTAAHCLDGRAIDVLLGRTVLSGSGGERIRVAEQLLPPGYDAASNTPDVAVLVLERPATAPPIPLAGSAPAVGTPLEVAGWGLVEQTPRELSADWLQAAAIQTLPPGQCARAYGRNFAASSMICAATPRTGAPDSCQGDSGGPLVARAPGGGATLVGVVSFGGQVCGDPALPGVYASVAANRAFLDGIVARVGAGGAVSEPVAPPADVSTIALRFGRMACPTSQCRVDIRTTGPVESLTGGLVLWVRRTGRHPIDRFALAQKVRDGLWRAWVDLPFGRLRLVAVGVDEEANPVTDLARTSIRVTPG
ncbi:MAG TPA: serine protease [Capillimicrobium sp.]|nr:serine protease [Capillimicrobium sp.]